MAVQDRGNRYVHRNTRDKEQSRAVSQVDGCSPHLSAHAEHLCSCTDMPGIRAARMLRSSGEGAVRALSTSHSHCAMPQPTVVLPRAAAHAAFAGDKPFLGSPFAACPTARSCLHPPLASAPAHGPVCDPLSVLPVPDKPEELWLDPDRGSLRWKALPSCKGEIIGYQVPGQTLTSGSGAVCRQTGKCGKGTAGMSHTSQTVNIWL